MSSTTSPSAPPADSAPHARARLGQPGFDVRPGTGAPLPRLRLIPGGAPVRSRRGTRRRAPSTMRRPGAPARLRLIRGQARTVVADAGMATAEYAIATLAACGFAALLLTLLKSAEVRALLFGIVKRALSAV